MPTLKSLSSKEGFNLNSSMWVNYFLVKSHEKSQSKSSFTRLVNFFKAHRQRVKTSVWGNAQRSNKSIPSWHHGCLYKNNKQKTTKKGSYPAALSLDNFLKMRIVSICVSKLSLSDFAFPFKKQNFLSVTFLVLQKSFKA